MQQVSTIIADYVLVLKDEEKPVRMTADRAAEIMRQKKNKEFVTFIDNDGKPCGYDHWEIKTVRPMSKEDARMARGKTWKETHRCRPWAGSSNGVLEDGTVVWVELVKEYDRVSKDSLPTPATKPTRSYYSYAKNGKEYMISPQEATEILSRYRGVKKS